MPSISHSAKNAPIRIPLFAKLVISSNKLRDEEITILVSLALVNSRTAWHALIRIPLFVKPDISSERLSDDVTSILVILALMNSQEA